MSSVRSFSYGGGVQSTAALVLASQGKIDFPLFIFANVGEDSENPATLSYVRDVARPYAETNGIEFVEVQKRTRAGVAKTIYTMAIEPSRSIGIPFRVANGAPALRNCTTDYKIKVIARELKRRGASSETPAVVGLGISIDEFQRAKSTSGDPTRIVEYPLIDLRLSRASCIEIIRGADLPIPDKSSCWFCPFRTLLNWQEMKRDNPALFARAVEFERAISEKRMTFPAPHNDAIYLTRFGKPLDQVVGDNTQPSLFDDDMCESGYCHV